MRHVPSKVSSRDVEGVRIISSIQGRQIRQWIIPGQLILLKLGPNIFLSLFLNLEVDPYILLYLLGDLGVDHGIVGFLRTNLILLWC